MSLNNYYKLYNLSMKDVVSRIEHGESFSALKLCHGFWELHIKITAKLNDFKNLNLTTVEKLKLVFKDIKTNWPLELYLSLCEKLATSNQYPGLLHLASELGWANGYNIEGTPKTGLKQTQEIIRNSFHPDTKIYDGLFWKDSILDQSFFDFIKTIRDVHTIIIGPKYIENFIQFAKLKEADFIPVHETQAAWERDNILSNIEHALSKLNETKVVCLFEAGGVTSSWLINELYPNHSNCFFLALGQALNICNFSKLNKVNWFEVYRNEICKTIELINPDWKYEPDAYGEMYNPNISIQEQWQALKTGKELEIYCNLNKKLSESKINSNHSKVSFIENKEIDNELLFEILKLSKSMNHWANFGPVSKFLESSLESLFNINDDRKVVVCQSATHALLTLVNLHEFKAKRKLRWVVSSFGFYSTNISSLANANIIDCEPRTALLDFSCLKKLSLNSWDAVIITNTFGLITKIDEIVKYCNENNKLLLIDNATALSTPIRKIENQINEVVSFHQTKPWGIGEGGCAILNKSDESIFRSLLNFGVGIENDSRKYSTNGKISDFSCALILQRIINKPKYERLYILQARRILNIGIKAGLTPFNAQLINSSDLNNAPIFSSVPFLAPHKISKEKLENPHLVIRKYYLPLNQETPNANDIYDRIINVPCHPEVAQIDTNTLLNLLKDFASSE